MRRLAATAVLFALAACTPPVDRPTTVTVSGPRADVERFVAQQTALHPDLVVAQNAVTTDGRARTALRIPTSMDGDDVVRISSDAIAARVNVQVAD